MKYIFIVGSIFKTLLCLLVTMVTLTLITNKVAKGQTKVTQYQENYVNQSSNLEQNNGNSMTVKVEVKKISLYQVRRIQKTTTITLKI